MTRYRIASIAGVVAGVLMSVGSAVGQSTFASNLGTVRDPSGGIVAGCAVTAENTGTYANVIAEAASVAIRESAGFQTGVQGANLFNHPNYATPNTTFNTAFGTISNVQSAEGAGPRVIRATARVTF